MELDGGLGHLLHQVSSHLTQGEDKEVLVLGSVFWKRESIETLYISTRTRSQWGGAGIMGEGDDGGHGVWSFGGGWTRNLSNMGWAESPLLHHPSPEPGPVCAGGGRLFTTALAILQI